MRSPARSRYFKGLNDLKRSTCRDRFRNLGRNLGRSNNWLQSTRTWLRNTLAALSTATKSSSKTSYKTTNKSWSLTNNPRSVLRSITQAQSKLRSSTTVSGTNWRLASASTCARSSTSTVISTRSSQTFRSLLRRSVFCTLACSKATFRSFARTLPFHWRGRTSWRSTERSSSSTGRSKLTSIHSRRF